MNANKYNDLKDEDAQFDLDEYAKDLYKENAPKNKPSPVDLAIELLIEKGFAPDGRTQAETFKIITSKSYPLAGAFITIGGRLRFSHPSKNLKATVGSRVVCFYDIKNGIAGNFNKFSTKHLKPEDVNRILDAAEASI